MKAAQNILGLSVGRQAVHFIHDQQLGDFSGADFRQYLEHVRHVLLCVRCRSINHMEDESGFGHLFQSGAKGLDQSCGKAADESYRVAYQYAPARGQRESPYRGVKSGEHTGIGQHPGTGQTVEQCGFTCIGVTHKRKRGQRHCVTLPPVHTASGPHTFQILLNGFDPAMNPPAVRFELGLTGTACSDTAAQP